MRTPDEVIADQLLVAARHGDEVAFQALITPHLHAMHVHAYRMLGSYSDADEAVQEVMVRAWRGLNGFAGAAPLRHWLYRITTTTCLKMISRRGRAPVAIDDVAWLRPSRDALPNQLSTADPAAIVDRRESVARAFMVALQLLPGTQRAVLILRDVLDWRSREVADLLDTTVAAVNSALQRARATLAQITPARSRRPLSRQQRRRLDALMRAWQDTDIPALAALLREDAKLAIPPQTLTVVGRDEVATYFGTVPAAGAHRLIPSSSPTSYLLWPTWYPAADPDARATPSSSSSGTATRSAPSQGSPGPSLFAIFGLPAPHATSRTLCCREADT